jgi:beta-lactamase superfamily II metal-dependent hydrolase
VKRWCENGEPARCPALRADVIKVPHHGSDHFAPVLYDAVQPAAAVISAGYNDMQHCLPRAVTVDAIVERGIQLVSTSGEDDENVVLTIEKTGAMSWSIPTHDVFAWRVAGKRCTGRLSPQAKAP